MNFVSKFLGTVRFENDQITKIIGYGDYQLGNVTISRVYYVEGLEHNLFSIGQLYDSDLEVAFRKNTCFIRNLEACALGKSKKSSHQPKAEDTNQEKLYLLHMDHCCPMRMESINGKKSKDEAPDAIIKCIKNIQVRLNATVRNVRTDNGTEFVNQTLREFYENLIHDKNPDLSFLYVFVSLYYPTNDSEDLGKLNAKADIGIFVGYAPAKKAFRIYNRRTQKIMETIHVTFDELTAMASEHFSLGLGLQFITPATSSSGLVPNPIPQQPFNRPTRNDWDHLAVDLADSPVSTSVDQDAPSTSIPSTQEQEQSIIISQGVKESPKTPHFNDDPLHESLHEDLTSQ
ncbi:retrovirus-related pol polyprotein from transposon TNT 1-94 [Tanacetum coccineum]|uniref:Retrovirus-related pol polyprotein from transposon TNT 1-94 n=1 Tax=Tanacetum coccineum TaxID=301880 RepID=A0ABQ5FEW4_9ASTR